MHDQSTIISHPQARGAVLRGVGIARSHRLFARASLCVGLLALAMSAGCAANVGPEEEDEQGVPAGELERLDQEVLGGAEGAALPFDDPSVGGTPNPPSGAVEVVKSAGGRCSGVMLGDSMVLTAAHCFKKGSRSGYFDGKIHLALTGRTWRCLTGAAEQPNGKCRDDVSISYERYGNAGEGVGRDMMALFPSAYRAPWSGGVAHLAARTVWTGALGWDGSLPHYMVLFGSGVATSSGHDSGTMRYAFMVQPDASPNAQSFSFNGPNDFRPCGGDSGGPFEDASRFWGSHVGALLGLHISHTENDTECTGAGQKAHATKLSNEKMQWINDARWLNGHEYCTETQPHLWWCP